MSSAASSKVFSIVFATEVIFLSADLTVSSRIFSTRFLKSFSPMGRSSTYATSRGCVILLPHLRQLNLLHHPARLRGLPPRRNLHHRSSRNHWNEWLILGEVSS